MGHTEIIKYAKDGTFEKEIRLPYNAYGICFFKNRLFVSVARFNGKQETGAVKVYDSELNLLTSIFEYDPRIVTYNFKPVNFLTVAAGHVLFIEQYNLAVWGYDPLKNESFRLEFPNENWKLDSVWEKKPFSEEDRRDIKYGLHRFDFNLGFGSKTFLWETCQRDDLRNLWVLDFEKKKAAVMHTRSFYRYEDVDDLRFSLIPGSYERGIIGTIDRHENFETYKSNYPKLADLTLNDDENPILVFLAYEE